uniref:Uncharacterized protein n=1 Tax=Zosterops lateralis melanops TaxID=1220523 RepID=A0A8D2PN95_ZOSLA
NRPLSPPCMAQPRLQVSPHPFCPKWQCQCALYLSHSPPFPTVMPPFIRAGETQNPHSNSHAL